jgi:hypothetical protein
LGLAATEEYKRWAGEGFKTDYSETVSVLIDCKFRLTHNQLIEH